MRVVRVITVEEMMKRRDYWRARAFLAEKELSGVRKDLDNAVKSNISLTAKIYRLEMRISELKSLLLASEGEARRFAFELGALRSAQDE